MELSDLKDGQRYRVTFEGEHVHQDSFFVAFKSAGYWHYIRQEAEGLTVEAIEPEYDNDSIYLDARGWPWQYESGRDGEPGVWYMPGDSNDYAFDVPLRPLTRLVPEQ